MKPDHCHEHDLKWADELINSLPRELHLRVCLAYCNAYKDAYSNEPIEHKKEGAARIEANTRLRKFVAKYNEKNKDNWSFNK